MDNQQLIRNVKMCLAVYEKESPEIIRKHLESGAADVNFKDANRNNNTVLHFAIEQFDVELIKLLLEYRADLTLENGDGASPFALLKSTTNSKLSRRKTSMISRIYLDVVSSDWMIKCRLSPDQVKQMISLNFSPSLWCALKAIERHGMDMKVDFNDKALIDFVELMDNNRNAIFGSFDIDKCDEYVLSKFIVDSFKKKSLESILQQALLLFIEILSKTYFKATRYQLNHLLAHAVLDEEQAKIIGQKFMLMFQGNCEVIHNSIIENRNAIIDLVLYKFQCSTVFYKRIIHEKYDEGDDNILEFCVKISNQETAKQIARFCNLTLDKNEMGLLLKKFGDDGKETNLFSQAMKLDDLKHFTNILEVLRDLCDSETLIFFVKKKDEVGDNALHTVASYNKRIDILNYFWSFVEKLLTIDEQRAYLNELGWKNHNILGAACGNSNHGMMEATLKIIKGLLDPSNFRSLLRQLGEDGDNMLHAILRFNKNIDAIKIFWSFIEEMFSVDEQKKYITMLGFGSQNILSRAFTNEKTEVTEFVLQIIRKFADIDLKQLIMQKDHNENSTFLIVVKYSKSNENIKSFWNFAKEVLTIDEQRALFMDYGWRKQNVLAAAFNTSDPEIYQSVLSIRDGLINKKNMKILLQMRSTEQDNAFHLIVKFNKNKEILELFWSLVEKTFTIDEQKIYFKELGWKQQNILCAGCVNESLDLFEIILKIARKLFDKDNLKPFLEQRDQDGNHSLYLVSKYHKSKEVFESFWRFEKEISRKYKKTTKDDYII